mmetsp:Transcript_47205/g.110377  ORF Transcript_47205/g.110377 Transcript_47205/m.110377 type:complete len:315 (-) Transcript_47205:265-1209(-)
MLRGADLPVKATPAGSPVLFSNLGAGPGGTLYVEWWRCTDFHNPDSIGTLVPKRKARGQTAALCPVQIRDEASRLPGPELGRFIRSSTARWRKPPGLDLARLVLVHSTLRHWYFAPPEEGQPVLAKVETHESMKGAARRHGRQRLNVRAFDLPRRLPHLPFADHRPGVRTKGDAAAPTGLKVHDGHTEVVRVRGNLNLQVNSLGAGTYHIRAESTPEVRHLVRVCHTGNLAAPKRRAKGGYVVLEVLKSPLPVDSHLPRGTSKDERAELCQGICPGVLATLCRFRLTVRAVPLQLHAVIGRDPELPPGAHGGSA